MIKVKVSEFSVQENLPNSIPELEFKGFVFQKKSENDPFASAENVRNDYLVIMTETEYREKMASRSGKKSNPLMMSFEDYNNG